ncbi:MAG: 1-acyl-sn-glycerol-3-phosphate acyltransferase [Proteiniphilum sp.]|nr:1-acyl-sn-glycerol-3-phosphate acyltransferase [Proteiniphilum sp.]
MIYRYDFRYSVAKFLVSIALKVNFRKMVFVGRKENVSKERAVIFAPNHRNALLDALLVVYATYHMKQVVFLARADIFRQKWIAWMLRGMRIMPVFRMHDGKDNLNRNSEIFNNAARILKNNNPIAIFPEARHNPKQSLLPLQKAVPRIVLPTEASCDFQLHSQVVPVSIYYRDISGFLSDVYITFGTPIEVSKYKDIYNQNPVQAINQLRQEMKTSLQSMVVNIQNDAFYGEYLHAIDWNGDRIAGEEFSDRKDGFLQASLHIVKKLDELFDKNRPLFDAKIAGFREALEMLKEHGLTTKDHLLKPSSGANLFARFTALSLTAPVALFGFLNGIFPLLINRKLLGMFEDKQFVASVRYASGLIFVPIFDLIQSLALGIITQEWWLALAYFIAMPATFYFAVNWRKWLRAARRDLKVNRFVQQFPDKWQRVLPLIAI